MCRQLDNQYLAQSIHEQRTPMRVNAMRMLHKYPALCDHPESQELVNLVMFGQAADGYTPADLDAKFGPARQAACPGMPTYTQLYPLSLDELKKVQLTKKLPSGEPINLRETYLHGAALLVDLSMRACEAWSRRPGRRNPSPKAAHP